jgi:hypothetical protein
VPLTYDGARQENGRRASEGAVHYKKPQVGPRIGTNAQDWRKGGDPGMACVAIYFLADKCRVLQALSSFGFQFITEQFLPQKLTEGDWI